MKVYTLHVIIFILVLTENTFAQPTIEWQNTIGGTLPDRATCLDQTADGGYIIGGSSNSLVSGDKTEPSVNGDYWVVKLNSTGGIEWQNNIGGSLSDDLSAVHQTADGGYILGGSSSSPISGDKTEGSMGGLADYWVIKLNSTGAIELQNTIGGNKKDNLESLQQTVDGGYILGGYSDSPVSGDKTEGNIGDDDYWVVKLSSSGAVQWQNTIGGSFRDYLRAVQQTADGGYILGGESASPISGDKTENTIGGPDYDYWIVKIGSAGQIQWQNTIGGNNGETFGDLSQTSDGSYIIGGSSSSEISGDKTESYMTLDNTVSSMNNDYWVLKLNSAGGIVWQSTIGGYAEDILLDIEQTAGGGYILGGHSVSGISIDKQETSINYDYWIVKLNSSGILEWENTIIGNNLDELGGIRQTTDGGYILCGGSCSSLGEDKTEGCIDPDCNTYDYDYWVIKLAPCTALLQYADADGDGYGDPNNFLSAPDCALQAGYVPNDRDCDDANAGIHPVPGVVEIYNGFDDDCNGAVDDLSCSAPGAPVVQWENTIGGAGFDELYAARQTADEGYILGGAAKYTGISGDKTDPSSGYWVVKLDNTGLIEWQNCIGGGGVDDFRDVQQTADGGYIVGGYSASGISNDKTEGVSGGNDYWVLKLNSSGGIEWQNTIGGNKLDQLAALQQTADGGYILGGSSTSSATGDKMEGNLGGMDYWVVKLNSTGGIVWQNTIGGNEDDILTALQQTDDGGYIIGGTSHSGISGDKTEASISNSKADYWVLKLNSTGGIEWQNNMGSKGQDDLTSVEQTADGGYIIGGSSDGKKPGDKSEESNSNDLWIVKLNASGIIEWENTIGGDSFDTHGEIHQEADGSYIIGSQSRSPISGDKTIGTIDNDGHYDYWMIKLSSNGTTIEWQSVIGGLDSDNLQSFCTTSDGGYFLGGSSQSGSFGCKSENVTGEFTSDFWVVKLSAAPADCPKPLGVQVTDITDTKATVSWTGNDGAYSYRIRKRIVGTATWIYSSVTAPATSKILSGNIADTQYEVQVQTYCDTSKTDSSGYTTSVFFTSAGECTGSTSQSTTGITSTSATLNWIYTSAPSKWTIKYKASGSPFTTVKVPGTFISYNLSGLSPSTNYDWKIRAKCGSENSEWSALQHFTTSPARFADVNAGLNLSVYPNPASGIVSLQFSIGKEQQVNIKVYDLNGKEVSTWLNSQMAEGDHTLSFNTSSFAKGIYFVRMITESGVQNQKLIVQ